MSWRVDHVDEGFGPLGLGLPSLVRGEIWVPWYFAACYGGVFAHDPKTGAFTMSSGGITVGHIVTHRGRTASLFGATIPGTVLLALEYGGVHAGLIDVSSGGLQPFSDPVFAGSRHVWVGYGASLLRFDPSPAGACVAPPVDIPYCMPNATVPLAGNVVGLAAGPDDTVVATTDSGVVEVHDGVTGTERWRATLGSKLAAPVVSDGVIVVAGADGLVHAYDAGRVWRRGLRGLVERGRGRDDRERAGVRHRARVRGHRLGNRHRVRDRGLRPPDLCPGVRGHGQDRERDHRRTGGRRRQRRRRYRRRASRRLPRAVAG